jgi:hypothetical protein
MPVPARCHVLLLVADISNPGTKKEPRTCGAPKRRRRLAEGEGDAARTTDGQLPVVHAKRQAACLREVVGTLMAWRMRRWCNRWYGHCIYVAYLVTTTTRRRRDEEQAKRT